MTKTSIAAVTLERLKRFRLIEENRVGATSVLAQELLDEASMTKYLEKNGPVIGSQDLKVNGSIFTKRYAFLAVLGLYCMSFLNKKIDVSPSNVRLVENIENSLWLPHFQLQDFTLVDIQSDQDKQEYIDQLFHHIHDMIQSVNRATKLSDLIMWENIAVYIYWLYENEAMVEEAHSKESVQHDFKLLLAEENHAFYSYHHNPLARYYTDKVQVIGREEEIRVRKTCCFSYKLENKEKVRCKTCPPTCKIRKQEGIS